MERSAQKTATAVASLIRDMRLAGDTELASRLQRIHECLMDHDMAGLPTCAVQLVCIDAPAP